MNRHERRKTGQKKSAAPAVQTPKGLGLLLKDAVDLHQASKFDMAVKSYQKILKNHPDYADVHYMLGLCFEQLENWDRAQKSLEKAIALKGDTAKFHAALGVVLNKAGQSQKAIACYKIALLLDPNVAKTHYNLGVAQQAAELFEDAAHSYSAAITLQPTLTDAWLNLGFVQRKNKNIDDAIVALRNVIKIDPKNAEAYAGLSSIYRERHETKNAIDNALLAHNRDPENPKYWVMYVETARSIEFTSFDQFHQEMMMKCLNNPDISVQRMEHFWISLFKTDRKFTPLIDLMVAQEYTDFKRSFTTAHQDLLHNPYILEGVRNLIIPDFKWEYMLRHIRQYTTEIMQETGELLPTLRAFIIALGHYAFATDFVFFVTDEEESFVQSLQQKDKLSADEVILLSTYAPLYKIPTLNYDAPQNDTDFDDLIRVQIHEPLQERALIETIKCYKPLQDEVSQKVRAQYEENPYPRWRRGYKMMVADITGEQERLNRRLGHILIAGCGTGQQIVNVATSSPNAHITAIDLSLSSIGYAKRKIDEFGLSHRVDFMQADILTLGDMDMRFDSVECAGVLHHMDDPMAGWRVLRSLLKPNGLMPIGLYSEMARQNIVQCRAEIAKMGLGNDAKSIRAYRDILRKRAAGDDLDEAMTGLFHSKDLFSLSECRDLLFHVQEHRFTIPQLKSCLEELDLEFLGFNLSYNLECLFTNLYPDPKDLVNLEAWHIAEQKNPLLFAAMYQFWCIAR